MRAVVDLVTEQRRTTVRIQMDIADRQLEQGIHGTMAGDDHPHAGEMRDQHPVALAPAASLHQTCTATVAARTPRGRQDLGTLVRHQSGRPTTPFPFKLPRHERTHLAYPHRRLPKPLRL